MAHTLRKVDKDFTFDEQRVEINELAVDVYNLQHDFGDIELNDIKDVNVGAKSSWVVGNIIKWDGTEWTTDIDVSGITLTIQYNPTTYNPVTEKRGNVEYNGQTGVFTYTPPELNFLTELGSIGGHTDVDVTTNAPSEGDVLKWDPAVGSGGSWIPAADSVNIEHINSIGDVVINNPQATQVLTYNVVNQKWENTYQIDSDTTYSVVTTSSDGLVPQLPDPHGGKFFKADGTWALPPTYTAFTGTTVGLVPASTASESNKFLRSDGSWQLIDDDTNTTYGQQLTVGGATPSSIQWDLVPSLGTADSITITAGNNITFTAADADGFTINSTGGGSSVQSDWSVVDSTNAAFIKQKPSLSTVAIDTQDLLNNLANVNAGSPSDGDSLTWDNASSKWINKALKLDDLDNVNIVGTPSNDAVLKYQQSSNKWILGSDNNSGGGSGGASVSIGLTAPSNPSVGDLWWKNDEGQLKIFYDDDSGTPDTQWVDTGGGGGNVGAGATAFTGLSDTPSDFTNQALKFVRVNQTEDELEFVSGSATDLGIQRSGTLFKVTCNTGTDASLPLADTDNWGLMSDEMFDKLEAIDFSTSLTVGAGSGSSTTAGVTLSDGNVSIRTGTGNVASIDLYCEVNNAHKVSIKAPPHSNFSGNPQFVLPPTEGDNGDVLITDGNGNTSWSTLTDNDTNVFKDLTGTPSSYDAGKFLKSTANGTEWAVAPGASSTVVTDDTAPTNPSDGELWWDSNSGNLKVYYQDVDSSAWVDATNVLSNETENTLTTQFGQQSFPRFNWDKLTLYSSTLPGNQRYGVYRSANKTNRTGADLSTIFDGDTSTFVKITDHETNLNSNNGSSQSTFGLVFDTPISDIIEIRLGMDGWAVPGFNGVGLSGSIWDGTNNQGKQAGTNGGLGRVDAPYGGKIGSAQEVIIYEGSAMILNYLMFTPFDDPNTPNPPSHGNWSAGTASDFITNLYYIKLKKSNGDLIELTYDKHEDPSALDEYILDQWEIYGDSSNPQNMPEVLSTPNSNGRNVVRSPFPFELVGGKGMAVDSNGVWTFPSPGVWKLDLNVPYYSTTTSTEMHQYLEYTDNDSSWKYISRSEGHLTANQELYLRIQYTLNIKDITKQKIKIYTGGISGSSFYHPSGGGNMVSGFSSPYHVHRGGLTFEKVQRVNSTY